MQILVPMKVLVTGSAGFIGFHLAQRLLRGGHDVLGFDGMTPYYDVKLKRARTQILQRFDGFTFVEANLEDQATLLSTVSEYGAEVIVHLAAQAGVRYSLEHPDAYIASNLVGTYNLLEAARVCPPRHLLFASTSSVYGGNEKLPFSEADRTDYPVSLYAATKKAGESMAHSYSHLFKMPITCFRFFTVYGPWGRPDMALFKFVERILGESEPIEVYNANAMSRDFTYIDDLVEGIVQLIDCVPEEGKPIRGSNVQDSLSPVAPWRAVNIAGGNPVKLMDFIETIERHLGKEAEKVFLPMQKGDVLKTFADSSLLKALTGFQPNTSLDIGVKAFVDWYVSYTNDQ